VLTASLLLVEEEVGGRSVLNQPAGHWEPGESLAEAVVREVHEETGYSFAAEFVVGIYLWQCQSDARSYLRICFSGTATAPSATPRLDTGIIATHWLAREQLLTPQRELRSPLVLNCIDDFRGGRRYPLDCLTHVVPVPTENVKLA
jgi:8-oxo-dGTP pyrophosphatase MutT (NUDIX family)